MGTQQGSQSKSAAKGGLAGLGVAAFAVICCGAAPVLLAAAGGIALGAVLGVLGGAIALVAIAALLVVRARRHRACDAEAISARRAKPVSPQGDGTP